MTSFLYNARHKKANGVTITWKSWQIGEMSSELSILQHVFRPKQGNTEENKHLVQIFEANVRFLSLVCNLQFAYIYVKSPVFYLEAGTSVAILCVQQTNKVTWFLRIVVVRCSLSKRSACHFAKVRYDDSNSDIFAVLFCFSPDGGICVFVRSV